jgi:DNA-binding response OmpR family regulator
MEIASVPSSEGPAAGSGTLRRGVVVLDLDRFSVTANGRPIALTRIEFDILAYLMRNADRVVSQEELTVKVLGGHYRAESSRIRVHLTHLRQKLGARRKVIRTIRRRGFLFVRAPQP